MAQDGEVSVKLRITAEDGGVAKAENGLRRVGHAAKKSAEESKGGLEQMQASVGRVSGAFGALRSALTGFGIGGALLGIGAVLSKIVGSFGAAKKSAEEFRAVQTRLAEDKAIAGLANDYARLADAANASAAAESHRHEMIDMAVANRRRLDSAKLDADKEEEIAALDADADDYAERVDAIEKRYAAIKAGQAASDAREDAILARQRTYAQADQTDAQADVQDAATRAIEAKIAAARRMQSAASVEAVSLNEEDKTGIASAIGKTLAQLFTGDWGRMGDAKTAEGDQRRNAAAGRAAQLELQVQQLEEEKRRSEAKATETRRAASRLRERADAMGGQIEAAEIAGGAARSAAGRGEQAAQKALDRRQAERAAEEAKMADARQARAQLAAQKAQVEAQIAAQQGRKDAAGLALFGAQGAVDLARANGDRRGAAAATERLNEAKMAAENVGHSADSMISRLMETLNSINRRIQAAEAQIRSSESRSDYAWREAPAA